MERAMTPIQMMFHGINVVCATVDDAMIMGLCTIIQLTHSLFKNTVNPGPHTKTFA